MIRVNEGGWYDPAEPGKPGTLSRYGDVNVLSQDIPTSKLGQGNCGHSVVGDVEKYTGPAMTVSRVHGAQGRRVIAPTGRGSPLPEFHNDAAPAHTPARREDGA